MLLHQVPAPRAVLQHSKQHAMPGLLPSLHCHSPCLLRCLADPCSSSSRCSSRVCMQHGRASSQQLWLVLSLGGRRVQQAPLLALDPARVVSCHPGLCNHVLASTSPGLQPLLSQVQQQTTPWGQGQDSGLLGSSSSRRVLCCKDTATQGLQQQAPCSAWCRSQPALPAYRSMLP